MKAALIPSSQLTKYQRMDAGFHLAINEIAEELAALQEKGLDPEAFKSQLKALPLYALKPLEVLLVSRQRLNTETAHAVIDKYPLESWLIVKAHISDAHDQLAKQEQAIEDQRRALSRFF